MLPRRWDCTSGECFAIARRESGGIQSGGGQVAVEEGGVEGSLLHSHNSLRANGNDKERKQKKGG